MYTTYGGSSKQSATVSTGANGYYAKMDGGGSSVGTMSGFTTPTFTATEANLGSGSVAFQLYNWTGNPPANNNGTDIASLNTVYNSGTGTFTTTIAAPAAAVPVPPSVLLLAPGLLGLVGLRRRWFN
jgi:hypothetical protein